MSLDRMLPMSLHHTSVISYSHTTGWICQEKDVGYKYVCALSFNLARYFLILVSLRRRQLKNFINNEISLNPIGS